QSSIGQRLGFLHPDRHNQEHHAHGKHFVYNHGQRPERLAGTQHHRNAHDNEMNHRLQFWLHLWKAFKNTHHLNMTKANKFTCPGRASRAAWACLGVASTRSRVLPGLIAGLGLILAGPASAQTFTTLYNLPEGGDAAGPGGRLVLSDNTLYGTTPNGGSPERGTVFAVNTDGTGFTTLYSFTETSTNSSGVYTNSDGTNPQAGLILSGNTLYG